ncbi:hypothetical protein PPGU19_070410 (plasmid) [Paraburkholderia sp. PGU19]|nr:hypothetical protein PPGU19_070410 [Paraburkholderia sp. PGU19]
MDDRNFVANRKWDEQIERDAVQIEDTFHSVAEAVCHGAEISLDSQRRAIQRFYVILRERSIAKKHTFTETSLLAADQSLNRVEKVDLDRFESQGIFMGGQVNWTALLEGLHSGSDCCRRGDNFMFRLGESCGPTVWSFWFLISITWPPGYRSVHSATLNRGWPAVS